MNLQWLVPAALAFTLVGSTAAQAADAASNTLLPAIDTLVQIVRDPALAAPARARARDQALRALLDGVMDFPDIGRRALGPQWQVGTEAERREFVALFRDLMSTAYLARMQAHGAHGVRLLAEREDGELASVLTSMRDGQGRATSMEYRVHRRGGRWLVHDVLVDGVSFVGNYRTQFNAVLGTSTYAELLRRMRERTGAAGATPGRASALRHEAWYVELRGLTFEVLAPRMR